MTFEIRNPSSFPKVLGVTDPGVCPRENTPELTINDQQVASGFTVWLSPVTQPAFPEPNAYCAGAQDVDYGLVSVSAAAGELAWPAGAPNDYLGSMTILVNDMARGTFAPETRRVVLRIGATEAEMLRKCELEHTDDQRHAFALTVVHLTEKINETAQYPYTGQTLDEAKTMLLQALSGAVGAAFVPAKPHNLWEWRDRVASVYSYACNKTGSRDASSGNHHSSWWCAFQPDETLLIYPSMPSLGLSSQELITLDGVSSETPDWTVPVPPPKPARSFKVGDSVLPAQSRTGEQVEIFADDALTGSPWRTLTLGQLDEDTYSANIELLVIGLVGEDGYLIQTKVTDPGSESQERKDAFLQISEMQLTG